MRKLVLVMLVLVAGCGAPRFNETLTAASVTTTVAPTTTTTTPTTTYIAPTTTVAPFVVHLAPTTKFVVHLAPTTTVKHSATPTTKPPAPCSPCSDGQPIAPDPTVTVVYPDGHCGQTGQYEAEQYGLPIVQSCDISQGQTVWVIYSFGNHCGPTDPQTAAANHRTVIDRSSCYQGTVVCGPYQGQPDNPPCQNGVPVDARQPS